jgi:hypothetical protein
VTMSYGFSSYENDTSYQLRRYIDAKKAGSEYTGLLNDEAKDVIAECGDDLDKLEREAQAIYFLDHTLFG